ncbi:hypothetical protein [Nitratireductor soli]|uniref:hypothetical protein n=1 Tax=Nitratireductor soli TaxID=1670619 RepID=UPI0012FC2825|nr:hypothetical protein [Nitratireductor soli]
MTEARESRNRLKEKTGLRVRALLLPIMLLVVLASLQWISAPGQRAGAGPLRADAELATGARAADPALRVRDIARVAMLEWRAPGKERAGSPKPKGGDPVGLLPSDVPFVAPSGHAQFLSTERAIELIAPTLGFDARAPPVRAV